MRRVSLALLLLLTCAVATGVAYVIGHSTPIPDAGTTPAFSSATPGSRATASGPSSNAPSGTADPSSTRSSAQNTVKVTFLGDDYTVGRGAKPRSTSWTNLIGKQLGVTVSTVGESDAGYAKQSPAGKTYSSLLPQVVATAPDLVVVSGGRNDVGDDPATLRAAARALFKDLHQKLPHARLLAIAPWWGDSPHPAALASVDKDVRSGVRAAGGNYLKKPDPLGGHPSFMFDAADPNNKGYRAIAASIAPAIGARLPR